MSEIRLDLIVKGKKRTFTQDLVPLRKALEYTEEEANLWKENEKGEAIAPIYSEMMHFRANFVASLFDDSELTGELILDGLDVENRDVITDIIQHRLLGYEKIDEVKNDPKDQKK